MVLKRPSFDWPRRSWRDVTGAAIAVFFVVMLTVLSLYGVHLIGGFHLAGG